MGANQSRSERNDNQAKTKCGPITNDITSVEYYDTIFALAESPLKKGMLWAGSDDGLVHVTTDDGAHWTKVTPKMPEWATVSIIDPSHFDAGIAYVAVDRHRMDDFKPYIFKTGDSGKTWTAIVSGIPEARYVRAVREDPKSAGNFYAGTELGVYVSFDDALPLAALQLNLPISPIHDLVVKDDDLVVRRMVVRSGCWTISRRFDKSAPAPRGDVNFVSAAAALRLHYPPKSISAAHSVTTRRRGRSSIITSKTRRKMTSRSTFWTRRENSLGTIRV